MEKNSKIDDIQSVQLLRGLAAFLVLLCHSVSSSKYFPIDNIIWKICYNGWIGVYIFFIISGFIIPYSMYKKRYELVDFRYFLAKRIVRIEPPYIVSIIMVLLFNYSNTITPWYKGPAFTIDWVNVLGHLGYLNAFTHRPWLNWAYWTLAIEFQYYIIIALLYPLITNKNKIILIVSFFVLLACTFLNIPDFDAESCKPFELVAVRGSLILPFLPFFLAGIALFLIKISKVTFREFLLIIIVSLIACFYRHGLIVAIINIITLVCINYIKKVPKLFLQLGTISYSLYLTHDILVSRFEALLERFTKNNYVIVWLLSIVACLFCAYIYYLLIEKPFLNLSKRIRYKHSNNMD